MDKRNHSRREVLKQTGLGLGLVASAKLSVGTAHAARRSRAKQLMETDVLVVGGGPAGIGAALGAARTGSKTLLIESYGFFGGVASWSLGMPINQMRPESKPRSVVHELLIKKLLNYGDQAVHIGQHQLYCNVDYLKAALLDALEDVGCKYLVHMPAVDTLTEGDRVTGVMVATKQGLMTIRAKVVVDCTGDADVAYFAGAETMMEAVQPRMPNTMLLNFANVTPEQVRGSNRREISRRARSKYPLIPKGWGMGPVSNCHHYFSNHTGTRDIGQFDMTDPIERSQCECVGRRQAVQIAEAMREFGGENLKDIELVGASTQIAVRETRRLKGVYILTEEDAAKGNTFEDTIGWRSGYLDLMGYKFTGMRIHDVPYRAILPVKVDGLLTAGRSISATHVAMAAGKSMGNCVATGHAAGLAAAMSAKKGIVPRELKVAQLQAALRKDEVDLTMGGKIQENISKDRGA
ncbi:MAG: FAD-dependent oxidoreductase [Planctomycetes bacterium]|nr:FAD-dependent oxidoreductase [Planctomycetota bacterium]